MKVVFGGVYLAESGSYLRLVSKGEIMFNFLLVDENNVEIPEKRNKFGHVILRSQRQYSEETANSFKLIKQ